MECCIAEPAVGKDAPVRETHADGFFSAEAGMSDATPHGEGVAKDPLMDISAQDS
jgi:hypothetical protein